MYHSGHLLRFGRICLAISDTGLLRTKTGSKITWRRSKTGLDAQRMRWVERGPSGTTSIMHVKCLCCLVKMLRGYSLKLQNKLLHVYYNLFLNAVSASILFHPFTCPCIVLPAISCLDIRPLDHGITKILYALCVRSLTTLTSSHDNTLTSFLQIL